MRRSRRPDPAVLVLRVVVLSLVAAYIGFQFAYTPVVVKMFGLNRQEVSRLAQLSVEKRPKGTSVPAAPTPSPKASAKPQLAAVTPEPPKTTPPQPPVAAKPAPSPASQPPPTSPPVAKPKPVVVASATPSPKPQPRPSPAPTPKPSPPTPKPSPPTPPAPAAKPAQPPAPAVAATTPPPPPKEPAKPAFQPPTFPSLEEQTKNWTEIPSTLLNQNYRVTLSKDVSLKASGGTVLVKAGMTAVLVGQRGGKLLLAPAEGAPAGGEVAIDDTNLKSLLTEIYDSWKMAQVQKAKLAFDTSQNSPPPPREEFGMIKTGPVRNDKPSRNADGSYPILLESMKQGHVREITPQNVKKWGEAQRETIDGKPYWTVIVSYTTKTMFGNFDVDAQARIYDGKVERWIYTGSGETVP